MAHARRKFHDLHVTGKSQIAEQALVLMKWLKFTCVKMGFTFSGGISINAISHLLQNPILIFL